MKHTPGPWKVTKPRKSHANGKLMYGLDGPECVSDYEDWGFTEANARMIAAAPDLLEALYTALPFIEDASEDATYNIDKVKLVLANIKATIKKATGEQV